MTTILETPDDDFDTLDQLLGESVKIADAKKAVKTGRKLSAEQSETLEANRLAEAANIWHDIEVYAHIVHTSCECGNHFKAFNGWYKYQEQRRGGGRRLVRADDHEGLPASQFNTEQVVAYCHACAPTGLPKATSDDLDILSTLGDDLLDGTYGQECLDLPDPDDEDEGDEDDGEAELEAAVDEILSTLE